MSDNPFSEPEDSDRTVVRGPQPRATAQAPGGPAPASAAARPAAPPPPPQGRMAGEAEAIPQVGLSPLAAAAAPLLDLLARLSGPTQVANPDDLRERAVRALRQFEADARAAEVSPDQLRAAHYALAAALDDVALATPWGSASSWGTRSLVSTFHQEVRSGERFFDLLSGMQKDPGRYREALEIAYLCLALGMQGRYRLARGGAAELDRVREGLYQTLTQLRGAWEREVSPHWRGVDAPHRPGRRGIPAWTAIPVVLAVLGFGWFGLSSSLNDSTDGLFERLIGLPPGKQPAIARTAPPVPPAPPPAPPRPTLADKARVFLEPEIRQGLVTVSGDAQSTLVRIRGSGMFASASATLDQRFAPLLARIGEALREEPGRVVVLGHSDNQPIRSVRFPSNFHLSQARAESAMAVVQRATGGDPARFRAEGRGEAEPIADNRTPEGREENRRIEIVVQNGGTN
ncbi:type VI secretion system protein TssL, long form [Roseomonas sp. OT10]|uniref:type VI secretion system protein TssL, long form n=1 Tax=Roseomonas cutis TaxID=2897332 RepID=UPI001E40FF4F|nr:type VI secretion system protein TssL, long form [Roseomonas sp. OT10]UFN47771.1 type VI secretion system protein TssL, long form [Roseomonas sp. OT10]